MQTKHWPKIGADISRLGFGGMRFPTTSNGKIDFEKSQEMIDFAYNNGINYFDTAHYYHGGESQEFFGKVLQKYPRESYYLATKMPVWTCKSLADAEAIFAKQLEDCKTDYFDFYLLHSMDAEKWENALRLGIFDKMLEYKKEGKIRQFGFSFHGEYDTFCEMANYHDWDFVQIQTNYVDEKYLDAGKLYSILRQKNIPCIIMEPLRGGLLANLPEDANKILSDAATQHSHAAWAFRWCMDLDNTAIILSGMSAMEQVQENIKIFSDPQPLSSEEVLMINRLRDYILSIKTVPCTHCNYCVPCPFGVKIPDVFAIYNEYELFKNDYNGKNDYTNLGEESNATNCTRCGVCLPLCPQNINIPDELTSAHKTILAIK